MKRFIKTLEPLSGLPNGFTEVEYLESTAGQYIDTGVGVKSNTVVKAVYSITSNVQGKSYFGARNSTNERFQIVNSFGVGAGYFYNTNVYPIVNKQFEIEMHATGEVYLDGIKRDATNGTFSAVAFDRTLYIFHTNYYDGSGTPTSSKFWKVQILEGDTLVRDYIPALDSNNRPCMYDRVEGKPYYNIATTDDDFSYGKKIIPVEYLESTGEQYIDTGVTSNLNTVAEMNFKVVSYSTNNTATFFGGISSNIGISTNISKTNTDRYSRFGAKYTVIKNLDIEGIKSTIKIDKNAFVINGQSYSVGETDSFNGPNMYLFKADGIASTYDTTTDIYSCQLWDNDVLVRDYIPVIDENNVGYMLDKVSHTLYENKGSGSFSYGKKVYKSKLRLVEEKAGLSGLPNGFTEVEYLESKNTNDFAIDTGIVGKDGIESEVGVWFNTQVNNQCVLGSWSNASTRAWLCYTFGKKWYIGYNATNQTTMDLVPNQWNIVKMTRDASVTPGRVTLSVNNIEAGTISYTKDWNNGVNLTLFRMNNDTGGDYYGSTCKVSYCKLWDNGVLVRDYIPCLDINNVPCMYDKIEGKVYYNISSGEFSYGKQIIPVEYLESTGTQWINTEYNPSSDTRVITKFKMNETTSGFKWLFASRNQNAAGDGFGFGSDGSGNITSDYNNRISDSVKLVNGTEYIIDKNKNICKYNDSTLTNTSSTFTCNYPLYIFHMDNAGTLPSGVIPKANCYYFKIYDNDTLVRDYIPVIDENNVGYMFDKVTHTLYENKGTGTFNYGEKVYKRRLRLASEPWYTKEYNLLTYLESTGTQYINTGVYGNLNTKIESKVYSQKSGSDSGYGIAGDFTTSSKAITMPFNFVGDGLYSRFGDKSITTGIQQQAGTYTFAVNKDGYYVDGTKIANLNTTTSFTTDGTIMLFGFTGLGRNYLKGKMYYCTIWDNDVLVRDFRPAKRKSDNKYGMLDMVTKQFYTNAGTGEFTGE